MTVAEGAEVDGLLRSLRTTREYLLETMEGLDEQALRRPILPSRWSCVGLLRHLTVDVERFWFQAVIAGDARETAFFESNSDNAWVVPPSTSVGSVFDEYGRACERSDAVIAAAHLDDAPAWWPDFFGSWRLDTVRDVVLHVLRETATHAGQMDAVRELVDGQQHTVLTAPLELPDEGGSSPG